MENKYEYKSYDRDSVYPAFADPFFADHLARYVFLADQIKNMTVLEVGAGHGYGSYYLSFYAKEVLAVDLNKDSLLFAKQHYSNANLVYLEYDIGNLARESDQKFDAVVCFEVIEHIPAEIVTEFMSSMKKLLKPNGTLWISTPNHQVVLRSGMPVPDFHINNYVPNELKSFLSTHFRKVEMYGQARKKTILQSIMIYLDQFNLRHFFKSFISKQSKLNTTQSEINLKELTPWKKEHGIKEMGTYYFSKCLWRQAGFTIAKCSSAKQNL